MTELEIALPSHRSPVQIAHSIEQACIVAGLRLTLKATLKQYPGCLHWHYQRGPERGTLEITYWPRERRAWFKVARGREGDWMASLVPHLKRAIEHDGEATC